MALPACVKTNELSGLLTDQHNVDLALRMQVSKQDSVLGTGHEAVLAATVDHERGVAERTWLASERTLMAWSDGTIMIGTGLVALLLGAIDQRNSSKLLHDEFNVRITAALKRTLLMNTPCTQSGVCRGVVALLVVAGAAACSGRQEAAPPATAAATTSATDAPIPDTASPYDALPEAVRLSMDQPFTGDFDALVKRRSIRVGVTFNRTHYFIDKGQERGLTYESLKLFENDLNTDLKTGNLKVHVVIVPMTRDQLYPALASGKIDMVAAMVTVRPELEKLAAFGADAHQRQRSGGHRARRNVDCLLGRPRRSGRVCPQRKHL
jgi:hypothetical protein